MQLTIYHVHSIDSHGNSYLNTLAQVEPKQVEMGEPLRCDMIILMTFSGCFCFPYVSITCYIHSQKTAFFSHWFLKKTVWRSKVNLRRNASIYCSWNVKYFYVYALSACVCVFLFLAIESHYLGSNFVSTYYSIHHNQQTHKQMHTHIYQFWTRVYDSN